MGATLNSFNMSFFREAADYGWFLLEEDDGIIEMKTIKNGLRGLDLELVFTFDVKTGDFACEVACSSKDGYYDYFGQLETKEMKGATNFDISQSINHKAIEKGLCGIGLDKDLMSQTASSIEKISALTCVYANWDIA